MDTMNIALPEALKAFVQDQVEAGGYGSVSDYIRELIYADQRRRTGERIDALLLDGLASGQPIEVDGRYWEAKKQQLREFSEKQVRP